MNYIESMDYIGQFQEREEGFVLYFGRVTKWHEVLANL